MIASPRCLAALILALGLLLGPGAIADPPREAIKRAAQVHFERGLKLYALGDYAAAKAEFELGRELVDAPEFLFNLAQCSRNLGQHKRALDLYEAFLVRKPDATNRSRVEEYIATERAILSPSSQAPSNSEGDASARSAVPAESASAANRGSGAGLGDGAAPALAPTESRPAPMAPPPPAPPRRRTALWLGITGAAVVVAAAVTVGLVIGLSETEGTQLGAHRLELRW